MLKIKTHLDKKFTPKNTVSWPPKYLLGFCTAFRSYKMSIMSEYHLWTVCIFIKVYKITFLTQCVQILEYNFLVDLQIIISTVFNRNVHLNVTIILDYFAFFRPYKLHCFSL